LSPTTRRRTNRDRSTPAVMILAIVLRIKSIMSNDSAPSKIKLRQTKPVDFLCQAFFKKSPLNILVKFFLTIEIRLSKILFILELVGIFGNGKNDH
jgi:hypothetical protein